MTSRERVIAVLNHKEADKIPVDFGGTSVSGIHIMEYANLLEYLGLQLEIKLFDPMMQLAMVDDSIRDMFGVDTAKLYRPRPKFGISIYEGYKDGLMPDGRKCRVPVGYNPVDEGDEYRIYSGDKVVASRSKTTIYYELSGEPPLAGKDTIDDIKDFRLKGLSEEEISFLEKQSKEIRKSNRAVITAIGASFREKPTDLRGFEQYMMDFLIEPEYSEYLLDCLVESYKRNFDQFKQAVGDRVDILKVTDDMGMKNSLMFSPEIYRKFIKPRQKELFDYFKKGTNYKILLHCDGQITEIIPDLIEVGVDAINPLDTAAGIDYKFVKKEFGKDITIWGGLIEPANMALFSVDEMENYVKQRLDVLSKDGRFVYCYTHNFQPDVAPEKVVRFFEIINEYCGSN